jgi:LysM repeat protein
MNRSEKQKSLNKKPTFSTSPNLANASKIKQATASSVKTSKESLTADNSLEIIDSVKKDTSSVKINDQTEKNEFVYYTVRKGDNFWTIAKKFPGVSNNEIMKINNIKAANSLKVGQVLKIMPKA